ncbi:lanthionine synthetase LanC family protein [Spongiimicrobium salis]|uniref:lanthionine synthetase LanC family protein n=1 Tax=Spongiimicrobium salis TaxID=1667022 RepID=UPI00374D4088
MILDRTVIKEFKSQVLEDADYFCSHNFLKDVENSSQRENGKRLEIAFFMLQVFSISKNIEHLSVVHKLLKQAQNVYSLSPNNMSFKDGGSGIIYIYVWLYKLTKNDMYLREALLLIDNCTDYFLESDQVSESLFAGRSGLLLNTFYLFHLSKEKRLLHLIDRLSRKIISNAVQIKGGLAWYNPFELIIRPLCSFGYGVSGIAYVFQLLGKYFNHDPFNEIANRSFFYINEQCLDENSNSWCDFRKNIVDEKDLAEHMEKFSNGEISFFKNPNVDHSIAHGSAGIIYSQLNDKGSIDRIPSYNKKKLFSSVEVIGIAQIQLELFSRKKDEEYYKNAKEFLSKLNLQKGEKEYISLATLRLAMSKGTSCIFHFPQFDFYPDSTNSSLSNSFLSDADIYNSLTKKRFPKTTDVTNQLPMLNFERNLRKAWGDPEAFFMDIIKSTNEDRVVLNAVRNIFEYEKQLNHLRLEQRFNPYYHVKYMDVLGTRMNALQIPEERLELEDIILSETAMLKKFHPISISSMPSSHNTAGVLMFWKYDLEKGVVEINLEPIKFLLDLFRKPKCIKSALKDLLYYCELLDDQALHPLITYSNSKNRADLIRRLPFVFPYQIKILIADGILKFA